MHPNAGVVRRGYHGFNTADMELLTETFDEGASWHTPGRGLLAGTCTGRDATFAQFGRYMQETGGTFRAQLRSVLCDDDGRVVAIHQNTGVRNGKRLNVGCCIVFRVENGRIAEGREHVFDLHAWDEFWS